MDPIPLPELIAELNTLLEAERAGARVGAALTAQAKGGPLEPLSRAIHDDEVRWARMLYEQIGALGGAASERVGDFAEKALAIDGLEARIAFTNRGQGWVVRKLRELIARVEGQPIAAPLAEMLSAHVANIAAANTALEAAAGR
jgi:nitronate monooxygenase